MSNFLGTIGTASYFVQHSINWTMLIYFLFDVNLHTVGDYSTLHTSCFVDSLCMMQVCIFAYGQTGSGKTHTMLGNPDIPDEGGVIPRSLEQVFQTSQSLSAQGWSFRMQVCKPRIHCVVLKTDNFRFYLVCIQLGAVCDYAQWFILNSNMLVLNAGFHAGDLQRDHSRLVGKGAGEWGCKADVRGEAWCEW